MALKTKKNIVLISICFTATEYIYKQQLLKVKLDQKHVSAHTYGLYLFQRVKVCIDTQLLWNYYYIYKEF